MATLLLLPGKLNHMQDYWEKRWQTNQTGWDLKSASPPLCAYAAQLTAEKRSQPLLIPGCGNGHEAIFLLNAGFSDVHLLDIAPTAVDNMRRRLDLEFPHWQERLTLHCADFFAFEGQFHTILEQTFFCALDPELRPAYVKKMRELLAPGGKLAGVWFDTDFQGGPPFGGSRAEYEALFSPFFDLLTVAPCNNSITPRAGTEVFMIMTPKSSSFAP